MSKRHPLLRLESSCCKQCPNWLGERLSLSWCLFMCLWFEFMSKVCVYLSGFSSVSYCFRWVLLPTKVEFFVSSGKSFNAKKKNAERKSAVLTWRSRHISGPTNRFLPTRKQQRKLDPTFIGIPCTTHPRSHGFPPVRFTFARISRCCVRTRLARRWGWIPE